MVRSTSARVSTAPAQMTRRVLLRCAAGAGLLGITSLPASGARAQSGPADLATSPRKVLVLGAGMAGLTAALALLCRGHDVTVIEYQNRVGGRLLSLPLQGGQFTESGGGHFRAHMPRVSCGAAARLLSFGLLLICGDGLLQLGER
jgi:NADPH-dependent 2,4-dienoyl-CoA reductase/sulfur reductase-like enzyme